MSKSSYDEELLKFNMYKECQNEGKNDTESGISGSLDIFSVAVFYALDGIKERLTRIEARQDLIIKAIKGKGGK